MRRDDEAVLAGRGGFPGADVVEVSVHATRERKAGTRVVEEVAGPLTLAHLAELVRRCEALGIDEGTVVVWQQTDGDGETHRVRCTGAGVRRPIEETVLAPRTDAQVADDQERRALAWDEGTDAWATHVGMTAAIGDPPSNPYRRQS